MKLENKKTGEIGELVAYEPDKGIFAVKVQGGDRCYYYSLAALNEIWKDYEEPKSYWFIHQNGTISNINWDGGEQDNYRKAIGNYFSSREEAEKAVEKLKALKRLQDNGMIKYSFHKEKIGIDLDFYTLTILAPRDKDSLDLLFGGEE